MLNRVQLIGVTVGEPEIHVTSAGTRFAILQVATRRSVNKGGERADYTTRHQVEVWNQGTVHWLATRTPPKGARVFIEGELRHDRSRDMDGHERVSSKVVVATPRHQLTFIDREEAFGSAG